MLGFLKMLLGRILHKQFCIYFVYHFRCRFAYVRQEDLFFSQLTVRETLSLAAELQLREISSVEERDEYVDNLLFKLGLVSWFDILLVVVLG